MERIMYDRFNLTETEDFNKLEFYRKQDGDNYVLEEELYFSDEEMKLLFVMIKGACERKKLLKLAY